MDEKGWSLDDLFDEYRQHPKNYMKMNDMKRLFKEAGIRIPEG
jgi:hypothetical protein